MNGLSGRGKEHTDRNIVLALVDRVTGVRSSARTIATFVVGSLTFTVDRYPTSESPFDSSGDVIAQILRSLQRSFSDADRDESASVSETTPASVSAEPDAESGSRCGQRGV